MILPSEQAHAAVQGRITLAFIPTRKPRLITARTKNKNTYQRIAQPWTPRTEHREPIQVNLGHKRETFGHVLITSHEQTTLTWVLQQTPEALKTARAAGYRTRALFANDWMTRHDPDWPPLVEELCPACDGFGEVDGEPCDNTECDLGVVMVPAMVEDDMVLERFKTFATTTVHAVHFQPDTTEHPRLLSPTGRPRGDELGYTEVTDTLEAGEAVDEKTQRGFVLDAHENRRRAAHIATGHERAELARLIRSLEGKSADVRVARELRHMRARLKRINALLNDRAA